MVDAVDLAFFQMLADGCLQSLCAWQVSAKWFLNHNTAPAFGFISQTNFCELINNRREVRRTHRKEERHILWEYAGVRQFVFQLLESIWLSRWVAMVMITRDKAFEHFLVIAIGEFRIQHALDFFLPIFACDVRTTNRENRHFWVETTCLVETE